MGQSVQIAIMTPGQQVNGFYIIKDIRCKTSTNGSPFLSAKIQDASGELEAKMWNYSGPLTAADNGKVMRLHGEVTEYNGARQIIIQHIRPADVSDQYDLKDLVPTAPIDTEAAIVKVQEILASIDDDGYRTICEVMLKRHMNSFKTIPAAKSVHHSFRSGLLMHTLNMLGLTVIRNYSN